jgi:hypothetical protein
MQKKNNPLNNRGNAMVVAAPAMFAVSEALFHANPFVGGALGILAGAIAYRHWDDVESSVETLKAGALHTYTPKKQTSPVRESQESQSTTQNNEKSIDFRDIPIPIGVDRTGKRFERSLRELKSILILGLQEGGKSNTAIHIARHMIKNKARVAIIDKHARSEEDSLTSKMSILESRFDCAVGSDPVSSMDVVSHVRSVLEPRMEKGAKCDYPLFLIVDEYTAIMRQKEEGGKWQACGQELASLIEDINTEGRKHQVFAICIGQIANVSRTGGGEIRELFATRIVHGMSQKQANLLSLTEVNKQVEALKTGEVFLQTKGINALWLKIPYVEEESLRRLAKTLPPIERTKARDPIEELAEMEEVDPDDSRYAEDDTEEETPSRNARKSTPKEQEKLVQIGVTNGTKEPVYIPQSTFDMLLNAARAGSPISVKSTQALLQCSEQHAKNVSEQVRERLSEA